MRRRSGIWTFHLAHVGCADPLRSSAALLAYDDHTGFPYPASRKGLPYGELQVLFISMGLFPNHGLLIALPALVQFEVAIADPLAGSMAPKRNDQLDG